jgi:hypothetical protein
MIRQNIDITYIQNKQTKKNTKENETLQSRNQLRIIMPRFTTGHLNLQNTIHKVSR